MPPAKGVRPAQLALAWVLAQGDDVVAIPAPRRRARLDENVGALDIRLAAEDLERVDRVLPPGAGAGVRYHAQGMQAINR